MRIDRNAADDNKPDVFAIEGVDDGFEAGEFHYGGACIGRGRSHNLWLRKPASDRVRWFESLFCTYYLKVRAFRGPYFLADGRTDEDGGDEKEEIDTAVV